MRSILIWKLLDRFAMEMMEAKETILPGKDHVPGSSIFTLMKFFLDEITKYVKYSYILHIKYIYI